MKYEPTKAKRGLTFFLLCLLLGAGLLLSVGIAIGSLAEETSR